MLDSFVMVAGLLSACGWLWLCGGRGGFWRADQRLPAEAGPLRQWPEVCAVIPARDEAEHVGRAVASLLAQDYPGRLSVIVVDDGSRDGTAALASQAGHGDERLQVRSGAPLPGGWTGKLWAMEQGVRHAADWRPAADFLLLTDADIEHHPTALRRLVAKAEEGNRILVSLMVLLNCRSLWERLLIPAFVFFFQKLYPFPCVNARTHPVAGAAGGCMLVRAGALRAAGGLARIRDRLIDDCALAALLKPYGPIWLGLSEDTRSLRPYGRLADVWAMVSRTAFTQLDHSPRQLAAAVVGMSVLYAVPPAALLHGLLAGNLPALLLGTVACVLMASLYAPTLALYALPAWRAATMPLAAMLYVAITIDSARRSWAGRGGSWKGRSFGGLDRNSGTGHAG